MKRTFFLIPLLALAGIATAQYGNEWINYNQTYYKFPVYADGVYRISFNTLANAGVPVNSIDPRNFQVFGRGQELFLHVEGESDGVFNPTDFIEFYAEKNNGWLDSLLYTNGNIQANPGYSLVTDTAYYFLTWNTGGNNSRMTPENDVSFGSYSESSYFLKEQYAVFSSSYFAGTIDSRGGSDAEYVTSEGWMDAGITLGQSKTQNIGTAQVYPAGPAAAFEIGLAGASGTQHHHRIQVGSVVLDTVFWGYPYLTLTGNIPNADLGVAQTTFTFSSINDQGAPADRTTTAYIKLTYAHLPDMEGSSSFSFTLPDAGSQSKSYLKCSSFNTKGGKAWLYDLSTNRRIATVNTGGYIHALVPNAGKNKKCLMVAEADIRDVALIRIVNYTGKFTDFINTVKDHNYLIITAPLLLVEGALYRNYRASAAGGGYNPVVIDVSHLYDQFSYGIKKHPLAIRNFCAQALDQWSVKPAYLFLLGKSIHAHDETSMPGFRRSPVNFRNCLVPSFGNPPSDNLLTAGLGGTSGYEPGIRTGRLAARNSAEVLLYLDKIQAYESQIPDEWMKRALHFGGGSSISEANRFKSHLYEYELALRDTNFGGVVHTFSKSTADPIQVNLSDSVADLVNTGVSIMTFFGHATSSGFDQNIDAPENFKNKDRYPLIVANSCFAGNLHLASSQSVTEQWVLTQQGGSIAFLAQVGLGVEYYTHDYSTAFFNNLSRKYYGQTLGSLVKQTIADVQKPNWPTKATILEMTLHGDPAVVINAHDKPDYVITEPYVYFTPDPVTNELDSFNVHVIMRNIGRFVSDSLYVEVERWLPNGKLGQVLTVRTSAPGYKDTLHFRFPVDQAEGIGINKLHISLDDLGEIDEISEVNNVISVDLNIKSADIIPVYPYEFAVIPGPDVTLKASTSDPLAAERTYVFEIDTTDRYNSPLLMRTSMKGPGGVLQWEKPVTLQDSMVYYWRVSPDSGQGLNYTWRESSFQYIRKRIGWGQAHYYQFRKDGYDFISYDEPQRDWDFISNSGALLCRTYGVGTPAPWASDYSINGNTIDYGACTATPSIHVAVIDSLTLIPWNTKEYTQFGNANCIGCCPGRNRTEYYFVFRSGVPSQRDSLLSMLKQIPSGHYVLLYTVYGGSFTQWNGSLRNELSSMGATLINGLSDNQPYIFFTQKGHPNMSIDTAGAGSQSSISIQTLLTNPWYHGQIHSTLIGPVSSWGSFHYRQHPQDASPKESVQLTLTGIRTNGTESTVIDTIPVDSIFLLPRINATEFPFMRLNAITRDDSLRTPVQIRRWQVIYDQAPEAAMLPNLKFVVTGDTVQQGRNVTLTVAAGNISETDMADSLLVQYWLIDEQRNRHDFPTFRVKRLLAGDTVHLHFTIPSGSLQGSAVFWAEINPIHPAKGTYDQIEQYHFNNYLQTSFYLQKDIINPVLDVTFDGVHILHGEIVSAKPEIIISLDDENQFLVMKDTALFEVYLKSPGDAEGKRVHFMQNSMPVMTWTPATLPKNRFEIRYHPELLKDGNYELLVRARDVSANISGDGDGVFDYRVGFEVINKSMITHVVNYPNPFSTSTRFVFTLTGSVIPDDFRIQIMTVSGKVVREIMADEIGPVKVGRNITQFAWNGTDQFGDRLANGLYLYRVTTRINGQAIEHLGTGADKYFHSGFGKMYLMR